MTDIKRPGKRRHIIAALLLLLAAVGIWGAVDLTAEHLKVLTDPDHESWCTVEGTAFDCAKVSESAYAEWPIFLFRWPLPTSIPPLGFFAGFAVLVMLGWWRRGDDSYPADQARDDTLAFAWLLLLPAAVVDGLLIYVMKAVLQTWCIVCLTLDVATLLLLILTPLARSRGYRGLFRSGAVGALRHANWAIFGAVFALFVVVGQRTYSGGIEHAIDQNRTDFIEGFRDGTPTLAELPWDEHYLGEPDAPFHVVEYADFQCPWCARCSAQVHALMEHYPGQIHFVFRHYPLGTDCNPYNRSNMHPDACMASTAAECAGRHGSFWEMYNGLFTLFTSLSQQRDRPQPEDFRALAQELEVPTEDFYYCLEDEAVRKRIVQCVESGRESGVEGTPALFANGKLLPGGAGATTYLELLIRDHLAQSGADLEPPLLYPE
jgi:protein-disulfide isomerase/uncharacterized membrane protein